MKSRRICLYWSCQENKWSIGFLSRLSFVENDRLLSEKIRRRNEDFFLFLSIEHRKMKSVNKRRNFHFQFFICERICQWTKLSRRFNCQKEKIILMRHSVNRCKIFFFSSKKTKMIYFQIKSSWDRLLFYFNKKWIKCINDLIFFVEQNAKFSLGKSHRSLNKICRLLICWKSQMKQKWKK